MDSRWPARIAGGAAGLANGLFGGGGGMVFLPILSRFGKLEQRKLYGKVPTKFLKWLFAAFLFYAGVKYLL